MLAVAGYYGFRSIQAYKGPLQVKPITIKNQTIASLGSLSAPEIVKPAPLVPGYIKAIQPYKPIPTVDISPQAELPTIITSVGAKGDTNCGTDPQMATIYKLESNCQTNDYNSIGCRGLGQACPGAKLTCSDSDWACQDAWFRAYAERTYGSVYNAYIFRLAHKYW